MSPVEFGNPVVRERTKPVRMLSARPPVAAQTTADEPRATSQPASPIEARSRRHTSSRGTGSRQTCRRHRAGESGRCSAGRWRQAPARRRRERGRVDSIVVCASGAGSAHCVCPPCAEDEKALIVAHAPVVRGIEHAGMSARRSADGFGHRCSLLVGAVAMLHSRRLASGGSVCVSGSAVAVMRSPTR